jgi:hypothetical protein
LDYEFIPVRLAGFLVHSWEKELQREIPLQSMFRKGDLPFAFLFCTVEVVISGLD